MKTSPHQDAADLVAELRARIGMLGPQPEQMLRFMNGMAPLLEKSANLIEQQAKALSEASQTCNSYSNRALAAEASLAEAIGILKFYADEANWQSPSRGFALQYDPEPSAFQKDRGSAARSFLNSASNKEPR